MKDLKQGGIHDHGLRISHQLRHDGAPQGFEKPPKLAQAAVERGGMEADDLWEEVAEKRATSRKKEREDSTPRSCWKMARVMTSESESFLREA